MALTALFSVACKGVKPMLVSAQVLSTIQKLNEDASVHGILVQLPLPKGMDERLVTETIHPRKDVDGYAVTELIADAHSRDSSLLRTVLKSAQCHYTTVVLAAWPASTRRTRASLPSATRRRCLCRARPRASLSS